MNTGTKLRRILKKNRLAGLMAGITVGFAVWGGQKSWYGAAVAAHLERNAEEDRLEENGETPALLVDAQEAELSLHAQSAVLIDADSGRTLYGKNETQIRPMASTTKIMTCILALELGNPDDICEVSKKAAAQPKVKLGAPAGSRIRLRDLLYSLMLESHNDSAVVIAEHISGSVGAFTEAMNRKAREIGCVDTTFLTPNGLDARQENGEEPARTHSTTAAELAQILRYCTEISPKCDEFLSITRTQSHVFSDENGSQSYACRNHNAMLEMSSEAVTGKTGFTGQAGYCYVAELSDGDRTYILALLGCGWPPHKTWKWADVNKLYAYGKEHFSYRDFTFREEPVRLPVENGAYKDSVYAVSDASDGEKRFHLLVSEKDRVTAEKKIPEILPAPVKEGETAGTVRYCLNGMEIGRSTYRTAESAQAWSVSYCFFRLFNQWDMAEMKREMKKT